MKKITSIFIILMATALAVSLSGCLGGGSVHSPVAGLNNSTLPSGGMWMERAEADIRSVDLLIKDGEVIARVTTELDQDESLDLRSIKVRQFRNTVNIYVPSVEPTRNQGNKVVDVKIGTIDKFSSGGEYTIVVNRENKKYDKVFFKIEDGTLLTTKPASVHSISFKEIEGNVIAVAELSVPDKTNYSIDEKNITSRYRYDRELDVYIPIMIRGEFQMVDFDSVYHEVTIGQMSQFSNGRYEIELNDREAFFMVFNGQLVQENIQDEYYDD
jgi:hypothetical protein